VPVRVSPTERIRGHIDELFARDKALPEILEDVARLGAQLLMQAALEAEVIEFPGRDRYQRAASCEQARAGSRNGYREVTVKTTAGPVHLSRPKLRGTSEAFASRLFGSRVTRTNALESLVIASFVRGLSVRDVEAALAEALGDQAAISKSTVSSACQAIKEEYQAWARRPLDGVTLDYLFLDASFFRMHPGSPAGPVLAAWGITAGGKPAFIGLAPGSSESAGAWHDFLQDLKDRGLPSPLPVISDGASGLIAADRAGFPEGPASSVPCPPSSQCAGEGSGRDAGRDQGRLLGPVRRQRAEDQARPQARRADRSPDHRDGRQVRAGVPVGDEMSAR
jgi:putative transposase